MIWLRLGSANLFVSVFISMDAKNDGPHVFMDERAVREQQRFELIDQ